MKATTTPTTATLTWLGAPADVGFIVLLADYNTNTAVSTLVQKSRVATVTGLSPNTRYDFQVVALSHTARRLYAPHIFKTPRISHCVAAKTIKLHARTRAFVALVLFKPAGAFVALVLFKPAGAFVALVLFKPAGAFVALVLFKPAGAFVALVLCNRDRG